MAEGRLTPRLSEALERLLLSREASAVDRLQERLNSLEKQWQTWNEGAVGRRERFDGMIEGLYPVIISEGDGVFQTPDDLLARVRFEGGTAAICDHRLAQTQFAQFTGAEFVANLFVERIPGVLLSTFAAIDGDTSIRLHRANIPYIIRRNNLDPDEIVRGLERCKAELAGNIPPERMPRRTLVRVVNVSMEGSTPVVDAIIHTWNPDLAIRFPMAVIDDPSILQMLNQGLDAELRLFAQVNVGCQDDDELFLKAFEFAPEPDIEQLTAT